MTHHEEYQYIDAIKDIIDHGEKRNDRTGVGTRSKFGVHFRFNLRDSFPLITTKRVFWKGVVEELLWLIHGQTDSKILSKKGVKIWDGNSSREFLDKLGFFEREEGDLGPVYGFQWRHFGADYKDHHSSYEGQGIDQLKQCIDKIKNNPTNRRIILTAWNPMDIDKMTLPPCHLLAQFYVNVEKKELSCQMYQRSADMGLGVPFNIASYSLLTCMIAQVCSLHPGEFVHVLGDAHVYENHVEPLSHQIKLCPRDFPTLELDQKINNIDDFTFESIKIKNYNPHPSIKMEMAV